MATGSQLNLFLGSLLETWGETQIRLWVGDSSFAVQAALGAPAWARRLGMAHGLFFVQPCLIVRTP